MEEPALGRLERLAFVPAGTCILLQETLRVDCSTDRPLLVDRFEVTRREWSAWLGEEGIDLDPASVLDASHMRTFEAFTGNAIWGGASLRYTFGDREGRSAFFGLGANYFAIPRVDYGYAFRRVDFTYLDELNNEVEDSYDPADYRPEGAERSRAYNNVTSIEERAGFGAVASFGLLWNVSDNLRFHGNVLYNHGINETMSLLSAGLGLGLSLP